MEDSLQDEVNRDQVFYRVYVRTTHSRLRTVEGGDKPGQWNAGDLLSVAV